MADDPNATTPGTKINTPRKLFSWIYAEGQAYPVWAAAILGFLAGWLLPKLARLLFG